MGIVGPVGSGKSTLFKLLLRLEDTPEDCIFLAGQDISTHSQASVRKCFSYVGQEPFLFSESIENNLRLSSPSASIAELEQAVDSAALGRDIEDFPDGLETILGERGISLSGGQKQRASLARALLRAAPILLLDDTLSAVDTVTESQILQRLRERQKRVQQSVIIVSHRLSAVQDADEILVFDSGRILERGRHSELVSAGSLYQQLHEHQSNSGGDHLV